MACQDFPSVRVFPSQPVITVDGDFKIYRRHQQREAIPVLMLPV